MRRTMFPYYIVRFKPIAMSAGFFASMPFPYYIVRFKLGKENPQLRADLLFPYYIVRFKRVGVKIP